MHGLVNRSIQNFISDSYGADAWRDICREADLGFDNFEAMLVYDTAQTEAVLAAACRQLKRPRAGLLEDMGTFLVSHPDLEPLRRLLRFGGETFEEFLHSLDDLHDRARLALPDLDFPVLELREHATRSFSLIYRWKYPGFGTLVLGVVRAMADDYGALVVLDHMSRPGDDGDVDTISVNLLDASFSQGRSFELGVGT
jgi:hypothetical protein